MNEYWTLAGPKMGLTRWTSRFKQTSQNSFLLTWNTWLYSTRYAKKTSGRMVKYWVRINCTKEEKDQGHCIVEVARLGQHLVCNAGVQSRQVSCDKGDRGGEEESEKHTKVHARTHLLGTLAHWTSRLSPFPWCNQQQPVQSQPTKRINYSHTSIQANIMNKFRN